MSAPRWSRRIAVKRHGDTLIVLDGFERRRLLERDAHIKPDRHQHGAEKERDSPRPIDKGSFAERDEQQEK